MKKGIHPDYHLINVVMTNGESFTTRSTFKKSGDTLYLDIDPLTHPAWTGTSYLVDHGGRISRFYSKFSGFEIKKERK